MEQVKRFNIAQASLMAMLTMASQNAEKHLNSERQREAKAAKPPRLTKSEKKSAKRQRTAAKIAEHAIDALDAFAEHA